MRITPNNVGFVCGEIERFHGAEAVDRLFHLRYRFAGEERLVHHAGAHQKQHVARHDLDHTTHTTREEERERREETEKQRREE